MSERYQRLLGTLLDRTQKASTRLTALLFLFLPVLMLVTLLVLLFIFAQKALPFILGGAFLVYFIFGDHIDAAITNKRITQEHQAKFEKQTEATIYRRIAIAIIPAVMQVTSLSLEPEDIFYDRVDYPNGSGIYFLSPMNLSAQDCLILRRLIINRLAGKIGIPRSELYQGKIVLVEPDHIFIRNDPRLIQFFSTQF